MSDSLELLLLASDDQSQGTIVARNGDNIAIESLRMTELPHLVQVRNQIELQIQARQRGARLTTTEMEDFGHSLFSFCIHGRVRKLYELLPDDFFRLNLLSNRADIHALPWEFIQEPDAAPGPRRDRSIVRLVPTVGVKAKPPMGSRQKPRILFVSADPPEQGPVGWPELKACIQKEFAHRMPNSFSGPSGTSVGDHNR